MIETSQKDPLPKGKGGRMERDHSYRNVVKLEVDGKSNAETCLCLPWFGGCRGLDATDAFHALNLGIHSVPHPPPMCFRNQTYAFLRIPGYEENPTGSGHGPP